ncbi:hypothetical protein HMPREF0578_0952 [Mobiluncus mulieris 28-1]|nr:hypothetical protein HMPREF0578_0952 [Mobiluncus mulieris 28-1]
MPGNRHPRGIATSARRQQSALQNPAYARLFRAKDPGQSAAGKLEP